MTTYHYYLDSAGRGLNNIEECSVWATCEHDTGYGACRQCETDGTAGWAAERADGRTNYWFPSEEEAQKWADYTPTSDPQGEWAVWWSTVPSTDDCVVARYRTQSDAFLVAAIKTEQLKMHNSGHLLCDYQVRRWQQ